TSPRAARTWRRRATSTRQIQWRPGPRTARTFSRSGRGRSDVRRFLDRNFEMRRVRRRCAEPEVREKHADQRRQDEHDGCGTTEPQGHERGPRAVATEPPADAED